MSQLGYRQVSILVVSVGMMLTGLAGILWSLPPTPVLQGAILISVAILAFILGQQYEQMLSA